jgi:hypothetical protein
MRWAGLAAHVGVKRNTNRVKARKPEGRRPLGRPRLGWEENIRMDFQELGWAGVDWIILFQDKHKWRVLVNVASNFRTSLNAKDFLTN